jgi:hypothetical protein
MKSAKELFNQIFNTLRQDKYKVERTTPTIGGMWTVDKWECDKIEIFLMDEGATRAIRISENGFNLHVIENYDGSLTYKEGNEGELYLLYDVMLSRSLFYQKYYGDKMYHLTFYDRNRNNKEMTVSYPTYEQVLQFEKSMDFERFFHEGEIQGTSEHKDWYAHKMNGAWMLFNRDWDS